MLSVPMYVHGVSFLRFAFSRKVHNDRCRVNFQLQTNTINMVHIVHNSANRNVTER